jgi:PAS domain S-box-containing protein
MRDVTEERRTEEALRAREDAVLAAFENAPMALAFALPGEGRFSAVNARLCKLLGYTRQELLEKTVLETTHPDDRERSAEVMQRLAGGGAREVALGKRLLRKDGSAVECEVQIVRLPQDPSEMPRTVVGFVDLTAQRGVEEQLRAAQRMEAVGRLAGGVAHDFNNLLTVILSNLDLARSELPESSPAQETLEEIAQAGRRAEGLTRQLLAFSRKQHMVLERVSLGDLVRGLASMLRRLIGEDVALELDVSDELPAVNADRGQLEQVLMNLVINARDALPEGGAIHVGVRSCHVDAALATKRQVSTGDYLELWVADDGIGMDEATRVRVFEPFFTTKDKGKGTGLGLSTVYGIVKQHGGGIDVESEPGAGTTFRIYLPKAASSAKEPTSTKVAPASTKSGHDETLLVVEDDTATRRVLRRVLEGSGYRVVVCATPAEALDQAAALGGAIDLVLTDVVMPGMNGCDLVRRMRDQQPSLRVVYMSGYTDDALAGLELPKGHFIRKPFALDDLRRVIRQMLDEPEGTRDSQAVS